jgi:hypothetical protein
MLVQIDRVSSGYKEKPKGVKGAYKEMRLITSYCTCKTLDAVRQHKAAARWFFREGGVNHRVEGNRTAVDFPGEVWLIDIPSLEEFARDWGSLVIQISEVVGIEFWVRIYDGYIE